MDADWRPQRPKSNQPQQRRSLSDFYIVDDTVTELTKKTLPREYAIGSASTLKGSTRLWPGVHALGRSHWSYSKSFEGLFKGSMELATVDPWIP